jgi:acyl transferase domain-containing protein
LYPEGGQPIDLPTYPWQRDRFWIAPPDPHYQAVRTGGHPLLGRHHEFSAEPGTHVWELQLNAAKWPYLADHRVEGLIVVPAAVYVELAAAAASVLFADNTIQLEQVRFQQMLVLPQSGDAEVQIVVHRKSEADATFQIASRSAQNEHCTVHVMGKMRTAQFAEIAAVALQAVQTRCRESTNGPDYYAGLAARGLDYGPAFQAVERLWRQDGESLAQLRVPAAATSTAFNSIHPIVLDACFQSMGAALPQNGDGASAPALPVGFEPGSIEGELMLLDDDGDAVALVQGFRLQSLERGVQKRDAFADWLFDIQWQPAPRPTAAGVTDRPYIGSWLVLADNEGVGQSFAQSLTEAGAHCVVVKRDQLDALDPAAFRQLLKTIATPCRGVVHFWGLDLAAPFASAQVPACMSVVHLVQALSTAGWRDLPRLWLITRGAQSVQQGEGPSAPEQATLWGLGRTIAMEHPELACTRIDVDASGDVLEQLSSEIQNADREDQIAFRIGRRRGPARSKSKFARPD